MFTLFHLCIYRLYKITLDVFYIILNRPQLFFNYTDCFRAVKMYISVYAALLVEIASVKNQWHHEAAFPWCENPECSFLLVFMQEATKFVLCISRNLHLPIDHLCNCDTKCIIGYLAPSLFPEHPQWTRQRKKASSPMICS